MKNEFKHLVDQQLSHLTWNEDSRRAVRNRIIQSRVLKRPHSRLAVSMALLMVMLVSIAVAAGLRFSLNYEAQQAAETALKNTYGITDEMLTFFSKTADEKENAKIFTYQGLEELSGMLGVYTVTVENGTVSAVWSLENQPHGWGSEKLADVVQTCKMEGGFGLVVEEARLSAQATGLEEDNTTGMPTEAEIAERMQQQAKEAEKAQSFAKLSWEEIDRLARAAIQQRYGMNDVQIAALELVEESSWWKMNGETPIVQPYYWLNQMPDQWTEGDGIYIVDMDAATGIVEGVLYDSAIAGNG